MLPWQYRHQPVQRREEKQDIPAEGEDRRGSTYHDDEEYDPEKVDELLDEIEELLERENSEEFVDSYIQRGGE